MKSAYKWGRSVKSVADNKQGLSKRGKRTRRNDQKVDSHWFFLKEFLYILLRFCDKKEIKKIHFFSKENVWVSMQRCRGGKQIERSW